MLRRWFLVTLLIVIPVLTYTVMAQGETCDELASQADTLLARAQTALNADDVETAHSLLTAARALLAQCRQPSVCEPLTDVDVLLTEGLQAQEAATLTALLSGGRALLGECLTTTSQQVVTSTPTATAVATSSASATPILPTLTPATSADPVVTVAPAETVTLDDGQSVAPWNGESRQTILLMGIDRRPHQGGWGYRTDMMMLVSIDPVTGGIGVLSIPRDLYVAIPGVGNERINAAMVYGENRKRGSGAALAVETVENLLDMSIDHYVVFDFDAVVNIVDLVGGIDVDVPRAINDTQYPNNWYGYDPFYLRAGYQRLDGETALKYARTRHGDSDFERNQRQQQVIFALRDRLLDGDALARLIVRTPQLFREYQENINTDMSVEGIVELALYIKDIPQANISTGAIDRGLVSNFTTGQGAAVLLPADERFDDLLADVFGANYAE